MKVRGFLIQDHLLLKKKEGKKIHPKMLFVDLLILIEIYWGYQYLSRVNSEFLTESWEAVLRSDN